MVVAVGFGHDGVTWRKGGVELGLFYARDQGGVVCAGHMDPR